MAQQLEIAARRKRWVAIRDHPLIWRSWGDGEHVVYSTASGGTHFINDATAEVLRRLEHSEVSFSDLVRDVADSFGTEFEEQLESYVAGLLVHLDQIGLVESDP